MQSNNSMAAKATANLGRKSQAASTSITGPLPPQRKLLFACEWHFRPEGVKDVRNRFERALEAKKLEAQHYYNEKDATFRIKVIPGSVNIIWPIFQGIVTAIIQEEAGEDDEDDDTSDDDLFDNGDGGYKEFSSNKIQELSKWRLEQKLGKDMIVEELKSPKDELYPDSVRFFKWRAVWFCPEESLDRVIPDETLQKLQRLTNCQFEKDLNSRKLYIGAHKPEHKDLALKKLDVIRKYFKQRHTAFHIFYSEGDANVRYNIKAFVHIKPRYFETTLLDNLHVTFHQGLSDYTTLKDAYAIRCAPYVHLRSEYVTLPRATITPAVAQADVELSLTLPLKDWVDFKYSAKGNLLVVAIPTNQISERASEDIILDQASTSARQPRQRDLMPSSAISIWANTVPVVEPRARKIVKKQPWSTPIADKPFTKAHILQRTAAAKGLPRPIALPLQLQKMGIRATTTEPVQPATTSVSSPLPQFPVLAPMVRGAQEVQQQNIPQIQVPAETELENPIPQHNPNIDLDRPRATNPEFSEDPHDFLNNRRQLTLLDDDSAIDTSVWPPLEPTRRINEQLQPSVELSTRKYHNTMNQRVGNKQKHKHNPYVGRLDQPDPVVPPRVPTLIKAAQSPDPLPEFLDNVKLQFSKAMVDVRGFRGRLDVQAKFGRIILRRFNRGQVAAKNADHLHEGNYIIDELLMKPNSYSPTTFFTDVLTTVSPDIQYLINMKNPDGKDMWEHKPLTWSVKYLFTFRDSRAVNSFPFVVEIDAETFLVDIYTRRVLGSIYVHGTQRQWDFRIGVTGYQNSRALEEKHKDLANAIVLSLTIPPNTTTPNLTWELLSPMVGIYTLEDLSVRRVCRYKSTDDSSILNVAEVQSLDIYKKAGPNNGSWTYRAIPGSSKCTANEKLCAWFEAGIECAQATKVLEHNAKLELGEEASWTADELANTGAIEALVLPAAGILKRMDGVGYNNHNGENCSGWVPSAEGIHNREPIQERPPVEFW